VLFPLNKYLVVEPIQNTQKEESTVLIPDDIEVDASPYKLVELLEAHADSRLRKGMKLVAPSHSIEQITVLDNEYYLLPETHVIAFHGGEEDE
jgi:co-chaperonin GroES (HSP10)